MDSAFVLAMIAGEGCFQIAIQRSRGYIRVDPRFRLRLDKKDSDVLYRIKEELGVGQISQQGSMRDFAVQSDDDCEKLVSYIEEHESEDWKTTHKSSVFATWKRSVKTKSESAPLSPQQKAEMIELSCELNQTDRGKSCDEWLSILSDLYDNYDRNT